jgi:hypothetical protein
VVLETRLQPLGFDPRRRRRQRSGQRENHPQPRQAIVSPRPCKKHQKSDDDRDVE